MRTEADFAGPYPEGVGRVTFQGAIHGRNCSEGDSGSLEVDSDDVIFEWDERKAGASFKKHHVAFEDAGTVFLVSLARAGQRGPSESNMKKGSARKEGNGLREEYDLSRLKGGVRGKYYDRATAGTNRVLIEPDVASLFPDSEAVNRALRLLAKTAKAATTSKRRRTRLS